ncbi:AsmA-like C-terminal region-containing protein [Salinicola sp. LHM]|uniref:YhdP family phospholipid transporter n=1 Tax=Salinicola sp. LHM TaxID=3065298 RepID=UPI002ACD31F1|nr:AsmA-like C-terminal region-containing protein [Salinicola sp. LHM]WQH34545.1 AsmA-like C-terminal region-containing protein [Salinicola sp. LHM]
MRLTWRWLLTLAALVAIVVAVLSTGVRLAAWQIDRLSPWLASTLEHQLDAQAKLGRLSLAVHHWNPRLAVDDFRLTSESGRPLFSIDHAAGRLETLASWQLGAPVIRDGEIDGMTLHLYQTADGQWAWPDGAGSRWFGGSDDSKSSSSLGVDGWLRTLMRQQATFEDVTLVLHGQREQDGERKQARVTVSRLTLASRGSQASIQATLTANDADAGQLHLTIENGDQAKGAGADKPGGASHPEARFVGTLDLAALSPALAVSSAGRPRALGEIDGQAFVTGAWRDGGLHDGRLSVDIPSLRVVDTSNEISETLTRLGFDAGLQRGANGHWQAWLDGLRLSHAGLAAIDWPQQLQARSTDTGWRLRSAPFELAGVTDYLRYLPLPFELSQTLIQLDPRGHVAGLEVGQDHGEWYAQSALEGASVTAWNEIPGGGPIDAWVTYRGRGGTVSFTGDESTKFSIPIVYADPLDLSYASGQVDFELTRQGAVISGQNLEAGWRGASAEGRFGLTLYDAQDKPGTFLLDLAFANADARNSRVLSWLPTRVIDDEQLHEWFGGDIGGIVKQGKLGLSVTLSDKEAPEGKMFVNPDDYFTLSLDVADGRLQYAPDWPALERVYGHLQMEDMNLDADIEHATSHGLTTRDAAVKLIDRQLTVDGDVSGSTGGVLDFLAHAPLETMSDTFGLWQSEGAVDARLHVAMPMSDESDAETDMTVDIQGQVDAKRLTFPELQLTLADIGGALRYRREKGEDYVTGDLSARAFDGPTQAHFNIGGYQNGPSGIAFEGQVRGSGLLDWAGLSRVDGLLSGSFPYQASVDFEDQGGSTDQSDSKNQGDSRDGVSLTLRSELQGLAITLPPPFGKVSKAREPLAIDADISAGTGSVTLGSWGRARWRTIGDQAQGQVWLEGWPGKQAAWPSEPGWYVLWRPDRVDTQRWIQALTQLGATDADSAPENRLETTLEDDVENPDAQPVNDGGGLKRVALSTPCILVKGRCLGGLQVDAAPLSDGWRLSLDGGIAAGEASWQPEAAMPIDVDLQRLNLDALTPRKTENQGQASNLMGEIEVAPHPIALPAELAKAPAGHVRVAEFERQGQRFGPLEATWQADEQRLTVDPLTLSLGELDLSGSLDWEAAGSASLSRARLQASGGDVGSVFRVLNQQVPITSESAKVDLQLSWPGAPWQFALPLSTGRVQATMSNGRLRQIHSSGAKLVGLFNLDNILRRLQLDFSDVTSGGTSFNSLNGSATLYNGRLQTEGPIVIDGTATRFTLAGSVDLNRQTLDQRLGITVPVSQNLPLVAVMAGAPQVGVGLFVFDQLFGRWLDRATQIYYRIEGPWSSPNINLESAQ